MRTDQLAGAAHVDFHATTSFVCEAARGTSVADDGESPATNMLAVRRSAGGQLRAPQAMAEDPMTTPLSDPAGSRRPSTLPVVSDQLEDMADTLTALANSLHGVAASLKMSALDDVTSVRTEFQANHLLSIVGHDLRASLTAMTGSAALIRERAPVEADRSLHGWADDILRSADTMERLIQDLEVTTFEAPPPIGDVHDVAELIGHVVEIFRPLAVDASLALTSEVAGPLMARYDAPKIFEVLAHLIENAIKFTPAGGSIRIAAARQDPDCVISVADSGVGIPDAALPTIFEPFRESNGERRPRGVGLSIARWIVEAHGGRIWAISQVGVGSAFYFTLPLDCQ
jgi:signal transduction histidine kinase